MSEKHILLCDDGHARLTADYEPEALGPDAVSITMLDGGGFTSLYIGIKDWDEIKNKMDTFIASLKKEPGDE